MFLCWFAFFFLYFLPLVMEKVLLASKNWFRPTIGVRSTRSLVEIHKTHSTKLHNLLNLYLYSLVSILSGIHAGIHSLQCIHCLLQLHVAIYLIGLIAACKIVEWPKYRVLLKKSKNLSPSAHRPPPSWWPPCRALCPLMRSITWSRIRWMSWSRSRPTDWT